MRVQGVFEYILLLAGITLLVLIVIDTIVSSARQTSLEVGSALGSTAETIRKKVEEVASELSQQ